MSSTTLLGNENISYFENLSKTVPRTTLAHIAISDNQIVSYDHTIMDHME